MKSHTVVKMTKKDGQKSEFTAGKPALVAGGAAAKIMGCCR